MSRIGEKVKQMIRNWLQIQPAPQQTVSIQERMTWETNVIKNQIWYRGDADELQDLYGQLQGGGGRFWATAPRHGEMIRKIHSGLPAMMVDILASIVKSDLSTPDFDGLGKETWEGIAQEINFADLVGEAIQQTLVTGDGAFKISVDPDISPYPLCEFYPADRVKYDMRRGRITGIRFYTHLSHKSTPYTLEEVYTRGRIETHLYRGEQEIALATLPELAQYHDTVEFTGEFMMAVPFRVYSSSRYPGRGKSIYDAKTDDFDAHDEAISQWMDAVRRGRVQRYIPEDLIPRDEKGKLHRVSAFGADYIQVAATTDDGRQQQIQTVQPNINYEAYLSTYTATLDMCLQGILSPATLGIDVGKMSSADAQREKKDITGHTRNAITTALEKTLPDLISALLMTYDTMRNLTPGVYAPTVEFGEYAAPDFDARVEVVNKAAAAGTMSVEAQVEELWGDSKDESWKKEEIARIRQMKGLIDASPPQTGDELIDVG